MALINTRCVTEEESQLEQVCSVCRVYVVYGTPWYVGIRTGELYVGCGTRLVNQPTGHRTYWSGHDSAEHTLCLIAMYDPGAA